MFFFCKQKTAYEMRISDWSSDVCSSDLSRPPSTAATTCALRRHTHRVVLGGGKLSSVSVSPDGPVTDAGRNLIFSSTSTLRSCGHAAVVPPLFCNDDDAARPGLRTSWRGTPLTTSRSGSPLWCLFQQGVGWRGVGFRSEEHTSE